ncbi:MAG: VOC family protein, partial [Streptomyces sp.]
AVASPDGGVRLVLNIAPAPDARGSRLQHSALATDDIIAAARRVRERGAGLLPIPANYYDDLDARHELDPEHLATLADLGILYDRDENGEFLHCYTATVGRVFFELVQRTGGYRGYGAGNAAVRLAAQHGHQQAV